MTGKELTSFEEVEGAISLLTSAARVDLHLRKAVRKVDVELQRLQAIESDLRALVGRHTTDAGQYPVAVAELNNVLEPGSVALLPSRPGYTATCSTCAPDGLPAVSINTATAMEQIAKLRTELAGRSEVES